MSVPLSAEAAFLHALIEGRPDDARETLADFSGSELVDLYRVLGEAGEMVASEHQARGPHAPGTEMRTGR